MTSPESYVDVENVVVGAQLPQAIKPASTITVNGKEVQVVSFAALTYKPDRGVTYCYHGMATPGTATTAAEWKIGRETLATGEMLWADGGKFTQVWNNRASLSYS